MFPYLNLLVTKLIWVVATAYCLLGTTASGHPVGPGTIATYRPQIPLGTRMLVPGYGWGTARDTGGDIGWGRIDLWYPACSSALRWGRRSVRVRVYF